MGASPTLVVGTREATLPRDYYEVLGVARGAAEKDIKAAYRRLARKYHPDVTGEDPKATERFKEISEAYECLSDPAKRRAYDLFGHPRIDSGGFDGFKDGFTNVADLFNDLFNRKDPSKPEPGVDVEVELPVSFREAFEGTKKPVEAELLRPCADCEGRGFPEGAKEGPCADCGGEGKVRMPGPIPFRRACGTCGGSGLVPERRCKKCGGSGTRRVKERLMVTVPAGVDTGSRLRLKGRGAVGRNGGPAGDLYVRVAVEPDPRFERDGDDLHTQVRVGLKEALMGGNVEVPLPTGTARMTLPAGTQGGQVFRLRDKGFPKLGGKGGLGDAFVTVQLRIPKTLDDDARRLLDELSERIPDL